MAKAPIPVLTFLIEHPRFPDLKGRNTIEMKVDANQAYDAYAVSDMIEDVRECAGFARKRAAGTYLVDYDSFGSESAYLNRVDEVAEEMKVIGVYIAGPSKRYAVSGIYSDGGGSWHDWVEATDDAEAIFQAKWSMAENQGSDPAEDLDYFLNRMDDIEITSYGLEPVTKDEYKDAIRKLVEEAVAAGHSGPALDDAIEKLKADGIELEFAQAPSL